MTVENSLLIVSLIIYVIDIVRCKFHKMIGRSDGDRQTGLLIWSDGDRQTRVVYLV